MSRNFIILAGFLLVSLGISLMHYDELFPEKTETVLLQEKIQEGETYLLQNSQTAIDKAVQIFSEVSSKKDIQKFETRIKLGLARSLEKKGDKLVALEIYKQIQDKKVFTNEEKEELYLRLGTLLLGLKREEEGRGFLETILRDSSNKKTRSLAYFALGECNYWNRDFEKAKNNFELSLAEDSGNFRAKIAYAKSLRKLGRDFESYDVFDSYIDMMSRLEILDKEISSEYKSSVYEKARELFSKKDYKNAISFFRKASDISDSPKVKELCEFYIASAYRALGKSKEAISHYNKVLQNMNPALDQEAIFQKGVMSFQAGDFEKASLLFQSAIDKFPRTHITERAEKWNQEAIDELRENLGPIHRKRNSIPNAKPGNDSPYRVDDFGF